MNPQRQSLINFAYNEIGTVETGPNIQKYGAWLSPKMNGVPWCMIFVAWLYAMAGIPLGTVDQVIQLAWVPYALRIWTAAGFKTEDPQPGDLVIFNWDKKGDPEHIAMYVTWIWKDKLFLTIEGNIGNRVWPHFRTLEFVDGFFNPKKLAA